MLQPTPFLDPRGRPADGWVEFIGGPLDGRRNPVTSPAPRCEGGFYSYADTRQWAYLWVPE